MTASHLLKNSAVNTHEEPPGRPGASISKEDVLKATSELNNLLQIISGSSSEMANACGGGTGSKQYLALIRSTIGRAETVAANLAEKAGGTTQKATIHPDLAGFLKPKKVADLPVAKPQILIVDDEEMALTLLRQLLIAAGYEVTAAQSGFECLDLFRRRPLSYQLVLLDLTMPFMDGEETFHRLREIRPDMPVMLSTGFIQNDRLDRLTTAGLAGFLRKPFAPDEVVAQVKAIIECVKYSRASASAENPSCITA